MKKFLVVIAVLAMTMLSTAAMAEITFDGSIEFLLRDIKNTSDWDSSKLTDGDYRLTYERLRLGVSAKHDNVKGRMQIENDWDVWGDQSYSVNSTGGFSSAGANPGFETRPNNPLNFREAWLDFTIPYIAPAHVKVGRQFLQLGNGWWFRSGKYGSDAWVVGLPGKNTIAFVDVKAAENNSSASDDTDAYVLLDTYKINDTNTVGAYIAHVLDRRGTWTNNAYFGGAVNGKETTLDNIGLHYSGKLGAVNLTAEYDLQMGQIKSAATSTLLNPNTDYKFKGSQLVVQANATMDAFTVRGTLGYGTGDDNATDTNMDQFVAFMDKDPHYTLVYEYYMKTAAGAKNTSFANTTAIGLGGDYKINKMFTVGIDLWMLKATEKVSLNSGAASDDIGNEADISLKITLYDQLTWNTWYGMFMTGDAYKSPAGKADDATAWHSVLSYKF
jgi:hypothetical protein